MGYISKEREEEYRDERLNCIISVLQVTFILLALILFLYFLKLEVDVALNKGVTGGLVFLFCMLKAFLKAFIISSIYFFFGIIAFVSFNFYFIEKNIYYISKFKYRNNMNDKNYEYLCKKLEDMIKKFKISEKRITKETQYLHDKNTKRNEQIKNNLEILNKINNKNEVENEN